MRKKIIKWIKAALISALVVVLIYVTGISLSMTENAYGDWVVNRDNVQERLYEAVDMFYAYLQMLVFLVSLLALSIWWLIHTVKPPKEPGRIICFLRNRGLYLFLGFAVLFTVLFFLNRSALVRIANTVETSEVPETLRDRIFRGRLEVGAALAAEGAVISLISWIKNRISMKRARTENAGVSSISG